MKAKGSKVWFVPDAFYPELSGEGHYQSHEAICILNTTDKTAEIELTLYFEDQEPRSGFYATCEARRCNHLRLSEIRDSKGQGIPRGVPYAILLTSSMPVICQYSRLDATPQPITLMTTIAYS